MGRLVLSRFVLFLVAVLILTPSISWAEAQERPGIYDLRILPLGWITPSDPIGFEVNVTGGERVRRVNVFYALQATQEFDPQRAQWNNLSLSRSVNYSDGKQRWYETIDPQHNGTSIWFYIEVRDDQNRVTDYRSKDSPDGRIVRDPPRPRINWAQFTINSIRETSDFLEANVTVVFDAYIPGSNAPIWRTSPGRFQQFSSTEVVENRFRYRLASTGLFYPVGDPKEYPWDRHLFNVTVEVDYANLSTSFINEGKIPSYFRAHSGLPERWGTITNNGQTERHLGDKTQFTIYYQLQRRSPDYLPLAVAVIGLYILTSSILISRTRLSDRLQIYFFVLFLAFGALSGFKLNPFEQDVTFHQWLYMKLMIAAGLFSFVSIIGYKLRKKPPAGTLELLPLLIAEVLILWGIPLAMPPWFSLLLVTPFIVQMAIWILMARRPRLFRIE